VKKTPVEGQVKKTSVVCSKEDRPVLPSGKTPHDIIPVIVLTSAKMRSRITGLNGKTDGLSVAG
jgi:hypothetical protein